MDKEQNEKFVFLLTENYRKIYVYIYALVPHRQDAEDLMQEVAVVLYRDFEKYTPNSNFAAWAKKIAMYKIMDFRNTRKSLRTTFSQQTMDLISQHIDQNKGTIEDRLDALRSCIEELDESDRQLIISRYKKGVTMNELAGWYKVSLATIYRTLERIHLLLMRCVRMKAAD